MKLENNTIHITGGTGGFGFEFALKLIAPGNTIIITGRNAAIIGMKNNKDKTFPGLAKLMRIMSRVAPKFALVQAGKMGA